MILLFVSLVELNKCFKRVLWVLVLNLKAISSLLILTLRDRVESPNEDSSGGGFPDLHRMYELSIIMNYVYTLPWAYRALSPVSLRVKILWRKFYYQNQENVGKVETIKLHHRGMAHHDLLLCSLTGFILSISNTEKLNKDFISSLCASNWGLESNLLLPNLDYKRRMFEN